MRLVVVGSGYVGLVAGACFSNTGVDVTVVDVDEDRIRMLREGQLPIYEPGLAELVQKNVQERRLSFAVALQEAVAEADVVVLAVGTPQGADGAVDMSAMDQAARQVARGLRGYTIIITKSTVPVGTYKRLTELIASETDEEFDYVANPEFLKEGAAVGDFLGPDRVIVGLTSDRALKVVRHLYAAFMRKKERLLVMDPASAELTKYACNCMLATRISFMNEMARVCDDYGANIDSVRAGMGQDHRIGSEYLYASLGFGGGCFPKDVKALISFGQRAGQPMRIVEAVDAVNQAQREFVFGQISGHFGGQLAGRRFAMWGLAFKARTDDVRESPAIYLVRRLTGAGAAVAVHDPRALRNARIELGEEGVTYHTHMYDALPGCDGLILCTEWSEYRTPDYRRIVASLKAPLVFDGRNLYDLEWMRELGFHYYSIGRPLVAPP